jgi:hypothetical protein
MTAVTQVIVDRLAGRLDEKHIAAANVLFDLAGGLGVGEIAEGDPPQRDVEVIADPPRQVRVRPSAKDFEFVHRSEASIF